MQDDKIKQINDDANLINKSIFETQGASKSMRVAADGFV